MFLPKFKFNRNGRRRIAFKKSWFNKQTLCESKICTSVDWKCEDSSEV